MSLELLLERRIATNHPINFEVKNILKKYSGNVNGIKSDCTHECQCYCDCSNCIVDCNCDCDVDCFNCDCDDD